MKPRSTRASGISHEQRAVLRTVNYLSRPFLLNLPVPGIMVLSLQIKPSGSPEVRPGS